MGAQRSGTQAWARPLVVPRILLQRSEVRRLGLARTEEYGQCERFVIYGGARSGVHS